LTEALEDPNIESALGSAVQEGLSVGCKAEANTRSKTGCWNEVLAQFFDDLLLEEVLESLTFWVKFWGQIAQPPSEMLSILGDEGVYETVSVTSCLECTLEQRHGEGKKWGQRRKG
jgi:hypothetical protein